MFADEKPCATTDFTVVQVQLCAVRLPSRKVVPLLCVSAHPLSVSEEKRNKTAQCHLCWSEPWGQAGLSLSCFLSEKTLCSLLTASVTQGRNSPVLYLVAGESPPAQSGKRFFHCLTVCGAVSRGCVFLQVSVMNVAIEDFVHWKMLQVEGCDISVLHEFYRIGKYFCITVRDQCTY